MTLEIFLGMFFALLAFDFCNRIEKLWGKYRENMKEIDAMYGKPPSLLEFWKKSPPMSSFWKSLRR